MKVTITPDLGAPLLALTFTASGVPKGEPIAVDCGEPPVTVSTTGMSGLMVSLKLAVRPPTPATTGDVPVAALRAALRMVTAIPDESVTGAALTTDGPLLLKRIVVPEIGLPRPSCRVALRGFGKSSPCTTVCPAPAVAVRVASPEPLFSRNTSEPAAPGAPNETPTS